MAALTDKRRAMLSKVHLAAKELALSDDSYRLMLARLTGKDSAKDCTDDQLDTVLGEFRRLGWTPKTKRPRSAQPFVRKIWAIWGDVRPLLDDGDDAALMGFVRRQTGIDRVEWLNAEQATKVIQGLEGWRATLRRQQGAHHGE